MLVRFEEIPAESRVWVYAGNRSMTATEVDTANSMLVAFCEQWVAHGHPLKTSFKIENQQFIILAVDDDFHNPSGCSIDSSVGVMRQLQEAIGTDFLNRGMVSFYLNSSVIQVPFAELKSRFAAGEFDSSSLIFNTLIATKADFETRWLISAEKSWLAKYLPKPALIS